MVVLNVALGRGFAVGVGDATEAIVGRQRRARRKSAPCAWLVRGISRRSDTDTRQRKRAENARLPHSRLHTEPLPRQCVNSNTGCGPAWIVAGAPLTFDRTLVIPALSIATLVVDISLTSAKARGLIHKCHVGTQPVAADHLSVRNDGGGGPGARTGESERFAGGRARKAPARRRGGPSGSSFARV